MPYSAIPSSLYPQSNFLSQDGFIYIGSTGSDANDGTTPAKAVFTLKRAWEIAKTYTIVGDATLYIQFGKGIYNYSYTPGTTSSNPFPINLYHPQGKNIVIQGDLGAIKQRYIYQVKDYSWDLSRWSYYGHTGTVNTWYAGPSYDGNPAAVGWASSNATGSGRTAHGFTAEDVGGYVSIFNAGMSTLPISGYRDVDNGVYCAKYVLANFHNYGRHSFNHGLSYEDSYGIVGLARIEGATSNPADLLLQFKYHNVDGRIHTYPGNTTLDGRIRGGLGNGLSYANIANNYPEPQYSQPNGYYGPTLGVGTTGGSVLPNIGFNTNASNYGFDSSGGQNISYPARPAGVPHITDDPHILTNFPVVIKTSPSPPGGNASTARHPTPIVMDGCELKSIRNLMFVNAEAEGATWGAKSQIEGFDRHWNVGTAWGAYPYSNNGMYMNDSKTRIRNLGFLGYGFGGIAAVTVCNSKLAIDPGIDIKSSMTTISNLYSFEGQNIIYAKSGHISNTPVLVCHGGHLYVDGPDSVVDFTNKDNMANINFTGAPQSMSPVWIQSDTGAGIIATGRSKSKLGPTFIVQMPYPPGYFRMRLELPIFDGATLAAATGSTGAFYVPEVLDTSRGGRYKSIVAYKNTGGTRVPIAKIFEFRNAAGYVTYNAEGWTGAAWSGGTTTLSTYAQRPIYTQTVHAYGLRLNESGFDSINAIRSWMSTTGNTLEFFAYSDHVEGVTVANEYLGISGKGIAMGTSGGFSLAGVCAAYNYGYTAADSLALYVYQAAGSGVRVNGHADIKVLGILDMTGRATHGAALNEGNLTVCGAVFVREATHSGILADSDTAYFNGNNVFVKHPVGYGYAGGDGVNDIFDYNYCIMARYGGKLHLGLANGDGVGAYGDIVLVGHPFSNFATGNEGGEYRGFGSTGSNSNAPNTSTNRTPLWVGYNGDVKSVDSGYVRGVLLFDGGGVSENIAGAGGNQNARKISLIANAKLNDPRIWSHIWNVAQGTVSGTQTNVGIMTRAPVGVASGSQLLYNLPRGATMWWHWDRNDYTRTNTWVGPNNAPAANNNTLYKRDLQWTPTTIMTGAVAYTVPTEQGPANAWNNTTIPGYSGPVVYNDGSATMQPYYTAP